MPRKATQVPVNPILIGDLPIAENEALATFERLPGNVYQNATIGKAHGNDEGTACDCHFVPGTCLGGEPLTLLFAQQSHFSCKSLYTMCQAVAVPRRRVARGPTASIV